MMNQGVSQFIIFVMSGAFIQEVLNIKLQSDNAVPTVGGNLTLSCLTRDLFNDGMIVWFNKKATVLSRCYTNGVCSKTSSIYSFTANISGAYAYIDDLDRARDEVTWGCSHCYGNINDTDTMDIVIYHAPEININVADSDHLNMTWNVTCEASGFPTNYTFHPWKQMIGEVTIRSDLQGNLEGNYSQNTLTLETLSLQDSGTYVCYVDNGVRGVNGDIIQTKATVLNVKGKPEVVNRKQDTFTGDVGSSVNIYVAFYSDPAVNEFTFQRYDSNVENTSRTHMYLSSTVVEVQFYNKNVNLTVCMAHLLINKLTEYDFGVYNLVLENSLGKTDVKVQLQLSDLPSMVATFYYTRFVEDEIEFHFDPGFNGGRNQTCVIEYSSVNSHIWTIICSIDLQEDQTEHRLYNGTYVVTVTKPPPGDYIYRIYSKNNIGRSPYSMNVSIRISQDKNHSHANPLVAAVVGIIVTAMVVIVCVGAACILKKKRLFSTKKSSVFVYQTNRSIRSLKDDIGAVYENMPVLNANVNVDTEYVNTSTDRQIGENVSDDDVHVYECI